MLTYLARYVRGGPLKSSQVESARDEGVCFRYRDSRDGRKKRLRVSQVEFIRRLAEHVPEPRHQMIRYAGIYASGKRDELAQCRAALGMSPAEEGQPLTAAAYLERLGLTARLRCPVCGRRLTTVEVLLRGVVRPPPEARAHAA